MQLHWQQHDIASLAVAIDSAISHATEELRAENERQRKQLIACNGTAEDVLDGVPLPGNWQDGTDGACPGWWRGEAYKHTKTEARITQLEGEIMRLRNLLETLHEDLWEKEGVRGAHFCSCCEVRYPNHAEDCDADKLFRAALSQPANEGKAHEPND